MQRVALILYLILTAIYAKDNFFEGLRKLERLKNLANVKISDPDFGTKRPTGNMYDFIVVGAGPGGCVVTNRLTENPDITVLLLEAGIEDNVITDIPILNPFTVLTDFNWRFTVDYDSRVCIGMENGVCPWPAGKGTGGGTILNAMIYTRGNRRDYDKWAEAGNPGWSYDEVLPYFLKVETTRISQFNESKYHGRNGPVTISYPPFRTPLLRSFVESGKYFGYREVDYNNPNTHLGFAPIQATMKSGTRVSAASAYLRTILNRPNWYISLRSRAVRLLINASTKRAYGVIYVENGKEKVVYARREVILAAGAFNTPQLLMLSGIGPAEHLYEMGIPVLQDLPVGDNLMEHLGMHGLSFLINDTVSIVPKRIAANVLKVLPQYIFGSTGILTTLGCEGVGYVQTKYTNNTGDVPDIELLFVASALANDYGLALRKTFGISDELYDSTYRPIDGRDAFSIWPMLLYPVSRGKVRLRNNNPHSKVRIIGNYISERIDVATLVEGIKIAVALTKTPPFQKYDSKLYTVPLPNCAHLTFESDAYWECTVRTITTQFHHQSGTCKMAPDGVVDPRLRVFGTTGIRVVDASIMTSITGGHTQATAYMIGEKAADLIKEDWRI